MSKTDRVSAALRGEEVDRVPVSAWWHDFLREWSPQGLAQATLEAYRKYDWDFIKVNPRASYYAEDWGARFRPSGRPDRQPELVEPAVKSAEDLRRIRPLDAAQGAYGEQLAALAIIARGLAGEAPFIQTVFSPLAVMSRLTGSSKYVQRLMADHPDDLLDALDAVAGTLRAYARACVEVGASGIFFATVEWGSADNISPDDYDRFARPFDLRVLEAVRDAPFNVLHVCRDNNHLARLLDYPVSAFHWAAHSASSAKGRSASGGNPSLSDIAARTDRAVMGGVSHDSTMTSGSPADVVAEARRAIQQACPERSKGAGGRRFLLAPGCSIDPQTPEANLRALVEAARS